MNEESLAVSLELKPESQVVMPRLIVLPPMLGLTQLSNYLTLKGSFSAGWLAGKPDYPQKLKVPEGYEKMNKNRNIFRGIADFLIAKESFTRTMCTATNSASKY